VAAQSFKLWTELGLVLLLLYLNLRGMRESIKVLLPIFLGFFVTHVVLILYGIAMHSGNLLALIPETLQETDKLTQEWDGSSPPRFSSGPILEAAAPTRALRRYRTMFSHWPSRGSRPASGQCSTRRSR
jgi:hypothetical protein